MLAAGPITLGCTAAHTLRVPWDRKISRVHARLSWHEGRLHVHRDQRSLNPIFYQGQARDDFEVPAGGWFVIGDTVSWSWASSPRMARPSPCPRAN